MFEYMGCEPYTLGVKCSYRKYARDRVYRIVKESDEDKTPFSIGYNVQIVNVAWYPSNGKVWSPLTALPTLPLEPFPIWKEFHTGMDNLLAEMIKRYGNHHRCIEQRKTIRDILPTSESASEFCTKQPLIVPLKDMLFGPVDVLAYNTISHSKERKRKSREQTFNGKKIKETYSTEHIRHTGNKGLAPPPIIDFPPGTIPVMDAKLAADPLYMKAKEEWAKCDINKVTGKQLVQAIEDINKSIGGRKKLQKSGNKTQLLYSINVYYQNVEL